MTQAVLDEKALLAARDEFAERTGTIIDLPSEGDLDDVEQERYDGFCAAIRAYLAASPPSTAGVEALRAVRPIIAQLIADQQNVETWGLKQRLTAIDAALASEAKPVPGEPVAASACQVEVKGLEWREIDEENVWRADSIIGEFEVGFDDGWYATRDGFKWEWEPPLDSRSYLGPSAAQSACQEHLSDVIRSALSAPSTPPADRHLTLEEQATLQQAWRDASPLVETLATPPAVPSTSEAVVLADSLENAARAHERLGKTTRDDEKTRALRKDCIAAVAAARKAFIDTLSAALPSPLPSPEVGELVKRFQRQIDVALSYAADEKPRDSKFIPSVFEIQVGHLSDIGKELASQLEAMERERDEARQQLAKVTDPEYLAEALARIDVVDGEWKARADRLQAELAEARRDLANECERRDDIINSETHLRKEAEARLAELREKAVEVVRRCQQVLASLSRPDGLPTGLTIQTAWAQCVEAESAAGTFLQSQSPKQEAGDA